MEQVGHVQRKNVPEVALFMAILITTHLTTSGTNFMVLVNIFWHKMIAMINKDHFVFKLKMCLVEAQV